MLIIIRGLPGSGKTTFAKRMFPECLLLEADMFAMRDLEYRYDDGNLMTCIGMVEEFTRKALEVGADVVISACFSKRHAVEKYLELAKKLGHVTNVYMLMGEYGSIHSVPPNVIERMRERWEEVEGEIHVRGGKRCDTQSM